MKKLLSVLCMSLFLLGSGCATAKQCHRPTVHQVLKSFHAKQVRSLLQQTHQAIKKKVDNRKYTVKDQQITYKSDLSEATVFNMIVVRFVNPRNKFEVFEILTIVVTKLVPYSHGLENMWQVKSINLDVIQARKIEPGVEVNKTNPSKKKPTSSIRNGGIR